MPSPLYRLRVPGLLAEEIRRLHPNIKRKLRVCIEELTANPRVGKPLKDELAGMWSFRIGKFRLIYRIAGNRIIELVAFGPRERIYEDTYRLIARGR